MSTIPGVLRAAAAAAPDREAVVTPESRLTFAQLLERVQAGSAACLAHGIGHGDRVAVPMAAPGVAAGAALAWARALGEFGATITFAGNFPGRTQTAPLAVYTALEQSPEAAVALSVAMLLVCVVVLGALRGRWAR